MMTEQLLTIHEAKATVENTAAVLAQINKTAEKTGSTIVLFYAGKVAGPEHISSPVRDS